MEIPFDANSLNLLKSRKKFRWDYELADFLGVDQRTISDWRAGRSKPTYRTVVLMMANGVTVPEITGGFQAVKEAA